jgi:GH24 family phage-related lysozyme (muramidase)
MSGDIKNRVAVGVLVFSLGAFGMWKAREGYTANPVIPTKGDVPTIGHGSTHYEDGTPVRMTDPPISRERAEQLAWHLMTQDEIAFRRSLPGAYLTQGEYDTYMDFVGQYGIGNWKTSSMRRHVLAGEYRQACDALLRWRFAAGYDCSTRINGEPNKRCWGSWERQLARHDACIEAVDAVENKETT